MKNKRCRIIDALSCDIKEQLTVVRGLITGIAFGNRKQERTDVCSNTAIVKIQSKKCYDPQSGVYRDLSRINT
jgi:hypothetical protein